MDDFDDGRTDENVDTFSTIVQLFKYMLGKLNMTKQYGKMTSAVADMIVKYGIGLEGTVSDVST
jgi:hypothetical protein